MGGQEALLCTGRENPALRRKPGVPAKTFMAVLKLALRLYASSQPVPPSSVYLPENPPVPTAVGGLSRPLLGARYGFRGPLLTGLQASHKLQGLYLAICWVLHD